MHTIRKAIIPVAGMGTRFLPATKAQPKEMLSLVDKPIIQYIVEEVVAAGITDVILVTSQHKRPIEDHFDTNAELYQHLLKKGKKKEAREIKKIADLAHFVYIRQKEPRGDGDAILQAASVIGDEPCVVVFGDDIITGGQNPVRRMIELYDKYQDPIIAVDAVPKKDVSHYGIVSGTRVAKDVYEINAFVEKPRPSAAPSNLAIVGKYVITPEVFKALKTAKAGKDGEIRLIDALRAVIEKRSAYAYQVEGRRFDCGSKFGFLQATIHFGLQHPEIRRQFRAYVRRQRF